MRDFNHTVNVLVKAYMNDELKHNDCCACAVGNIVHAAGFKKYEHWNFILDHDSCGSWKALFMTNFESKKQIKPFEVRPFDYAPYVDRALEMVKATGYIVEELAQIEFAFETADKGSNDDQWMFNGLMSVVDVLADIHGIDLKQKEKAKAMFVKV